ncbi:MAG: molybdopterin-dependent oxidoreductase [Candidatus Lokiarchaeota archaeon]|nr:molybdopterin-dependent oxidoreductase [Candidatus Lokiarchaeota archaeon]MBD3342676.1 molybdopterin-dependent oxidoreductase [Candidatus Lokiarchaeota archaeon]
MENNTENDKRPRLPPGQHLTDRFPVLQKGRVAHIEREVYTLEATGEVENPRIFTLDELKELQDEEQIVDIHCVTSWSKFDTKWSGLSFKKLLSIVKPKISANYVEFYCADGGFTTTVPLQKIKSETAMLALKYDGVALGDKHGGPVRALIPELYFYKSAKWVLKITFLKEDRLGYWEKGGYSNKADPWREQRYSHDD